MNLSPTALHAERRLTALFREVGPNLKAWGTETKGRYLDGPVNDGNPVKIAMGSVLAAASAIMEAPDAVIGGIADNKVNYARTGFRTTRDVGQFAKNVVTLHPIRAVTDALRLPGSVVLDGGDILGGFTGPARSVAMNTRNDISSLATAA